MDKLKFGETAVLENGKEYVCFACLNENEKEYVYLVSNFKPLEVRFAEQVLIDGVLHLKTVEEQALKQHLFDEFKNIKSL